MAPPVDPKKDQVAEMDQDVPGDHEIERYGVEEGINRSLGDAFP
jgi:hypothetical protein